MSKKRDCMDTLSFCQYLSDECTALCDYLVVLELLICMAITHWVCRLLLRIAKEVNDF